MKVLQLIVISVVYVVIVINGAAQVDAPLWLVSIVIIGPFAWWLYAPMFRRRPSDLREDERGCPPSLLDLLLEQTPQARAPAAGERPSTIPPVPRKAIGDAADKHPAGERRR